MRAHLGVIGLATVLVLSAGVGAAEGLRTLARGAQSGIKKPERVVAKTQEEWSALWKRHAGESADTEAPKVDWSKEMVLGVFMGTRNTGGYAIQITGVQEQEGKLAVRVETKQPKPGGFVTQALTAPFHLVAVPRSGLPVTWSFIEAK